MEKIYVKEILEAVGGQLLGNTSAENTFVVNVQTDSRKAAAGDLFVAIVGERMDGHRFVQGAMEAGAEGCLVSTAPESIPDGKFCVLVPDTAKAMGDLAAYYRRKLGLPVVAVTGSVGKTTTKDMVASVLSSKFRTLKTAGNLNNHLGLPMTVFRLTAEDEVAVLEMGMNHLGEYLVRIAQPDVAVITNVGDAHIGNLGSRENILRAKCEIFHGLKKGGTAVLNGDDALLATLRPGADRVKDPGSGEFTQMYAGIDAGGFTFHWAGESDSCDYRAVNIEDTLPDEVRCEAQTPSGTFAVEIPSLGRHMIYPAMTAAAVGQYFGLSDQEIAEGIANFKATHMRMVVEKLEGGVILYNDSYNANTQSMKAALSILANSRAACKVAVLGDMLEDVRPCQDKEEARKVLAELIGPDTAFLFKASRGMALEELCAFVRDFGGEK